MEYEDRVRISTPEGVDVELTLAGIGSRFIAAILDAMIQGGVLLGAALLLGVTGDGDASGFAVAAFSIIFFFVFFGYDVLFEVRSRGRTLGKRWTGLRVVRTGGRPVTFVPSCVRNVMRVVDILPALYAIGMLSIFVTNRNQRLGDLAAGTLIVRDRPGSFKSADAPWATPVPARGVGRQRGHRPRHRHGAPVPRPPRRPRRRPARGARERARAPPAPARGGRARAPRRRGVPRAPVVREGLSCAPRRGRGELGGAHGCAGTDGHAGPRGVRRR